MVVSSSCCFYCWLELHGGSSGGRTLFLNPERLDITAIIKWHAGAKVVVYRNAISVWLC